MRSRLWLFPFALVPCGCVERGPPSVPAVHEWTVEGAPTIVLGGDADAVEPLYRIRGVTRINSGYLIVNAGARELRTYSNEGLLLHTIGRDGAGPGEFRSPQLLGHLPGDSIAVTDGANRRISIICEDSRVCAEWSVPVTGGAFALAGDMVLFLRVAPDLVVDRIANERLLYLTSKRGSEDIDTLFEVEGIPRFTRQLPNTMMSMPVPFTHTASVVMLRDKIIVSDGRSARLSIYDASGNPRGWIDVPVVPRRLTSAEVHEVFEERIAAGPPDRRSALRSFYEAMPEPEYHSPIRRLVVDRTELVWVELDADDPKDHHWMVMDTIGAVMASVTTPSGFEVMEIGADYLLGVWRDELDVEFVQEYRLVRR